MNSSFSALPTTLAAPAAVSGSPINSESIQFDNGDACGFVGVLGEVCSTLSPELSQGDAAPLDGEALLASLQALPQGGKLLPLLQQTLDSVARSGSGIDLKQFVERLTAGLQELARNGDAASATGLPAEQLAMALQQLVQEQPALRSALPAEVVSALEGNTGLADKAASDKLLRNLSLSMQQKGGDSSADTPTNPQSSKPFTLDLTALQPPGSVNTQVPDSANMAELLAAVKRLSPDAPRSTPADAPLISATASSGTVASAFAPATAVPVVAVNTPLGQADWDQALGERIQWLAGQKVQGAQVKLNPANLGPMEVRIQVQNDQASVQFSAHHAVVREALEAALPRLREMFEASGVQLVNVDVSSGSFTGQQQAQDMLAPHRGPGAVDAELTAESSHQAPLVAFMASGRLDLFA